MGNKVAALKEYSFTKKGDESGGFSCKLYKTKDGNRYDFEDAKSAAAMTISRLLKSAIDAKENSEVA